MRLTGGFIHLLLKPKVQQCFCRDTVLRCLSSQLLRKCGFDRIVDGLGVSFKFKSRGFGLVPILAQVVRVPKAAHVLIRRDSRLEITDLASFIASPFRVDFCSTLCLSHSFSTISSSQMKPVIFKQMSPSQNYIVFSTPRFDAA